MQKATHSACISINHVIKTYCLLFLCKKPPTLLASILTEVTEIHSNSKLDISALHTNKV